MKLYFPSLFCVWQWSYHAALRALILLYLLNTIAMESAIKIWILVAVAGIMATILGFIIKIVTAQVIHRLDEIVDELKQLTHITTIQNEQIKGLQEQDTVIHRRLQKHGMRIRALEFRSLQQEEK